MNIDTLLLKLHWWVKKKIIDKKTLLFLHLKQEETVNI